MDPILRSALTRCDLTQKLALRRGQPSDAMIDLAHPFTFHVTKHRQPTYPVGDLMARTLRRT
ncbi:hypothetical protein PRJ39_22450 [Lysobacter enzymogenes]|uniref:hypothetical protein n=1 Tax=Lysobacter TaxID=68 RepID=UPI001587238A|nr:hypothetical protein [Lysobacter sp. yr284]